MVRQLLSSEPLYQGTVFQVVRDRLLEVSGLEIVREVVRHNGGAGALPVFADGQVALVRQYRHPARAELLEIPAGKLEAGELPQECAARELEQEIGWRAGRLEKLGEFYTTPGFCEEKLYVYLATELQPAAQQLDEDEVIEVVYLPLTEAVAMALRGELEDSKTLLALLWAERRLRGAQRAELRTEAGV
jgi:ADP-ribose pyrophosphatase